MSANWFASSAPVARRVRAYFAPVNRATQAPVLFDPAGQGNFSLDSPPAPWISLGWIQGFARTASSKSSSVAGGIPSATLQQVRESINAQVSFQFQSWTKLTMALATNTQHMNLLTPVNGTAPAAVGARAIPAVAAQVGSTATSIALSAADGVRFSPGQIVAVDIDYIGQTGFVGSPISGAYVRQPLNDVDYIRRVTFNVALVAQVSATGITLSEPLPAGAPMNGAKLQVVPGFVDREGGSFYQEWSALFVIEGGLGDRIFFHYPRLQSSASAAETTQSLAPKSKLERVVLAAHFLAMPIVDPLDGERVLCYRSYLPAPNALV